jgi:hypothetical protein
MFGFEYLLAVTLLTSPPDAPETAVNPQLHAKLKTTLQTLAVQWEILDTREVHYILSRAEDFQSDLNLLRRRYRDLADAPSLADSMRFPDRETINDLLAFNRAYRQNLTIRQPVELVRCWELRAAMQETEHLYQVWDTVRDARCDYYYVTVRRQALKKLRTMLGDDAYYFGRLPPAVPIWRFQEID